MQFGKLATVFGLVATAAASPIAQRDLIKGVELSEIKGIGGNVQKQLTGCVASVTSGLGLDGLSPNVGKILQGVDLPLAGRDSNLEDKLDLPGLSPDQLKQVAQGLLCLKKVLPLEEHVAGETAQVQGIAQEKLQPLLKHGTALVSKLGVGQIIGKDTSSKRDDSPISGLASGLPTEVLSPVAAPLSGLMDVLNLQELLGGVFSILGMLIKVGGL